MQRLTLIIPIADKETGNVMAAVIGNNDANMTTFDNSLLTAKDAPEAITHCWQSSGVSDEERARLAKSLELFPSAVFIFHTNDEAMLVMASNSEIIMALQGQPLSPMDALDLLNLAPFQPLSINQPL